MKIYMTEEYVYKLRVKMANKGKVAAMRMLRDETGAVILGIGVSQAIVEAIWRHKEQSAGGDLVSVDIH